MQLPFTQFSNDPRIHSYLIPELLEHADDHAVSGFDGLEDFVEGSTDTAR